jgi:hypothetical protein
VRNADTRLTPALLEFIRERINLRFVQMKKKPMAAGELAAQLSQDPAHMAMLEERARSSADISAAEKAATEYLANRGYPASSLSDLVNRYAPIGGELATTLVELLGTVKHPNVLDSVVRALGATRHDLDLSPLIDLFEGSSSESLRWAIGNTIAEARPPGVGPWVLKAVSNSSYGKSREMLALAAARTNPPDQANPVLLRLLDELPGHAALGLAESGTASELPTLERAYKAAKGWEREQIGRTIAIIRRRKEEGP